MDGGLAWLRAQAVRPKPPVVLHLRDLDPRFLRVWLDWWELTLHVRGRRNVTWLPPAHGFNTRRIDYTGKGVRGHVNSLARRKWGRGNRAIAVHAPNDIETFKFEHFTPYEWRPFLGAHLIQREQLREIILAAVHELGEICCTNTPRAKRAVDLYKTPSKHRLCYCVKYEHRTGLHECEHGWTWSTSR